MILRYIWRKSENSICCAEVTWYVENGACVGCEPRLGKLEGDYIISEYNLKTADGRCQAWNAKKLQNIKINLLKR